MQNTDIKFNRLLGLSPIQNYNIKLVLVRASTDIRN